MNITLANNWKKLALVGSLVVVVALGAIFGAGRYLKGSFSGDVTESFDIPSPANVAVTKDANGAFVLSWSYKKEDHETSNYFYVDSSGKTVKTAAFEWIMTDADGNAVWSTSSGLASATSPSGESCKQKLSHEITEVTDTDASFVCQDVYLGEDVLSLLVPETKYTIKVRADLGMRGEHSETLISLPGVSEFILPLAKVPKLDFAEILPTGDLVWGWNDADNPLRAGPNNSLYRLHEEYAFNYVWKLLDDTNRDGKLVWQRRVNDDPKIESLASECYLAMGMPVEGQKVWACQKAIVPSGVILPDHTYILSVAIDNGKETTAYVNSKPFYVKPLVGVPNPVDEVIVPFDEKTGIPLWFAGRWSDRDYGPSATTTLLKTGSGEYVFGYYHKILDVTEPNDKVVVFDRKFDDDPGVEPPLHDPALKPKCFVDVVAIGKRWTCEDAYIPTSVKFLPGHTYVFQIAVSNGYGTSTYVSSPPIKIPVPEVTEILPQLDYLTLNNLSSTNLSSLDKRKFEYGWNDKSIVPNSKNTKLIDASGKRYFVYLAFLTDDETGKTLWHNQLGKAVTPELPDPGPFNKCLTPINAISYWTCDYGYIPSSVPLAAGKKYTLNVAAVHRIDADGTTYGSGTITKTFVIPVPDPITEKPAPSQKTAALSNLIAKRQNDGSVAVSYSVDLSGTHVAPVFTSEVRVGALKDFAVKFTEVRKSGVSSYDYQAVLLPWEINNGDKITVAVGSSDLAAEIVSSIDYKYTEIQKIALGFASASLPSGQVGSAYSATIGLTGGVGPYKFLVLDASMLPPGISVGATGVVSGTPGSHGQYPIKVSVVDNEGSNLVGTLILTIAPQPTTGGGVSYSSGCYGPCPKGDASGPIVNAPPFQANPLKFTFKFDETPAKFKDIFNHWARSYISVLFNAGVVQGFSDVRFGPDDEVTRAQLLKVVMTSLKYPVVAQVAARPCYDIPQAAWYAKYFQAAKKYGIVSGYEDGSCRPNKAINRAEAVKILFGAIEKMPLVPVTRVSVMNAPISVKVPAFKDVASGSWYHPTFNAAIRYGIIQGFGGGYARPEGELSRGQLAKIMVATLKMLAGVAL